MKISNKMWLNLPNRLLSDMPPFSMKVLTLLLTAFWINLAPWGGGYYSPDDIFS